MITSRAFGVGYLTTLVVCLQVLLLAQSGDYAVFRSQDGGRTWSRSDAGLPVDARINAFGTVGSKVLAGTDAGIFVSDNRGMNWKPATVAASFASFAGRVLSFATLGESVYAGTDRSGVLVSLNGGVHWTAIAGNQFRYVRTLLAHEGALYAGTDAQGVFISRDGGMSWGSISGGLPRGGQVFSLAGLRGRLFAALYSKGLYVWTGEGPSWRKLDSVAPLVLATAGETLLAGHNPGGIFHSLDSGATWASSDIPFSADLGKAPVWELASGPDLSLAGVSGGIYYSQDRGRTWTAARTGLPDGSSGIAFLVDSRFVLAGTIVKRSK